MSQVVSDTVHRIKEQQTEGQGLAEKVTGVVKVLKETLSDGDRRRANDSASADAAPLAFGRDEAQLLSLRHDRNTYNDDE